MEILRSLSIDRHSMFNYSKPSFYPNPHFMNVDFTGNQNDYLKKIPLKINVANLKPKIGILPSVKKIRTLLLGLKREQQNRNL